MEQYNELQNFNRLTNFENIKAIIKEGNANDTETIQLEKIYNYLSNKKKILYKILDTSYNNIKKLQNFSFLYKKTQERKMIKLISDDLNSAEIIKSKITSAYTQNNEYINANSEVYIKMVNLYNDLEDFYKMSLLNNGNNEILNRKMEEFLLNIREQMSEIKQEGDRIEYEVFKAKCNEINIFFQDAIKTVLPYYKFKKIIKYFEEVNLKIEELLPTLNSYGFNNEEIIQIKQQKVIGEAAISKIKHNLESLNFFEVEQQSRIACNCLEKTLNTIMFDSEVKNTIKNDLSTFDEYIKLLEEKSQDIFTSITNIEENVGSKDTEINNLLHKSRIEYSEIIERKKFIDKSISENSLTNLEIVNGIKQIIDKLIN
jgi:ribosomal protein L15E